MKITLPLNLFWFLALGVWYF